MKTTVLTACGLALAGCAGIAGTMPPVRLQSGTADHAHEHLEQERGHPPARPFCARGIKVRDPAVLPALGDDASALSDHELIMLALDAG